MSMLNASERPASFARCTRADWEAAATLQLGSRTLHSLASRTLDDIVVEPLAAPLRTPTARAWRSMPDRWLVMQRVEHPSACHANARALDDLRGGADALALCLRGARAARGAGISATAGGLSRVLADVDARMIALRVEPAEPAADIAALADVLDAAFDDLDGAAIDFGIDPHGDAFARGASAGHADGIVAAGLDQAARLAARGAHVRAFFADGRPYHEAGASEAQELGLVLATAIEHLRAGWRAGEAPAGMCAQLAFLLVADADQLLTTAKFRALRALWRRVERASSLEPLPIRLHAETSWTQLSRLDAWTNLLRNTLAAFAAGTGGADTITVLAHAAASGDDEASHRLARNVQHVLIDEAHLGHCQDPGAGAPAFEQATRALCEAAWDVLRRVERGGGIARAIGSGLVGEMVTGTARHRADRLHRGLAVMVGVNAYPDTGSADPLASTPTHPVPADFTSPRVAEPFEGLRAASHAARLVGHPWRVVLVRLGGDPSEARARRDWSAATLRTIGIEPEDATLEEACASAEAAGTRLAACLCDTDARYREAAPDAATRLRAAGYGRVALAGRPGAAEAAFRNAGIEAFLHVGCDLVSTARSLGAAP